jgi:Spy/CpxP family protein refolding chaperone
MRHFALTAIVIAAPAFAFAQHHADHGSASPYAGEKSREIKSLSEEDISTLRRGGGWELAKPAELNGVPGPAHLLELKDKIPLIPEQIAAIEAVYEEMRTAAIAEGERYIAGERKLEEAFGSRSVTEETLRAMLEQIEQSRVALRYIHLSTHLKMPAILTEEQIRRYNDLRGYRSNRNP